MDLDEKSYRGIIENLHDGLYCVDKDRKIIFWNREAENISGFRADEVMNKSCADNILTHVDGEGNNICLGMCPLAASIADGKPRRTEVYMHHKDGHRIPVSVRTNVLVDGSGAVIGGVELFSDISNTRANELRVRELERMALLDHLTQLANRTYIERELQVRIEEKKRHHVPFGILFVDIDHFKNVNDTYGHDVGDIVLKFVANTLLRSARPFDFYGRWGGEEFIGIIRNINHEDLQNIGNRLRLLVQNSYIEHDREILSVTVSLGATIIRDSDDMDSLIRRADVLLYKSKAQGRNRLNIG